MMLKNVKQTLMSVEMPESDNKTCFHCPCKWQCALWLWDKWNVNHPLCSCTDARLISLDNTFAVNQELLDEWGEQNPMPQKVTISRKERYFGIAR